MTAVGRTYLDAIAGASGQPIVLPPGDSGIDGLRRVLQRVDGVCLPGGPDVDPRLYGATEIDERVTGVDAEHDAHDLAVARLAVEMGLPLLAICRGHQVLNVALGGTLVQHIDAHRDLHHSVALERGSLAAAALGCSEPAGYSLHHQAIDRVADPLRVSGRAPDGTIEAVELPGAWVLGVQWHPEETVATDPAQRNLFASFVAACRVDAARAARRA